MFWGLIMEPTKRYTQTVKKPFHISMASIDLESSTDDAVQVMCAYDNRKYLLCTLQKDKILQCPLDLNFDVGTNVSFVTNGGSHVHLTGYLVQDEEDFLDALGDEEEEEEDEEVANVSLGNISSSNIISGKRSKSGKAEGQLNGLAAKVNKKLAALSKDAPPAKKLKTMDLLQDLDDEDDEDDSDVDLSDLIGQEGEDDSMLDEEDDEEEEEEEDDDEEEEEEMQSGSDDEDEEGLGQGEEDSEEEGESEQEQQIKTSKAQQNGAAKKSKKELAAEKKKQVESKSPKVDKKLQISPQKRSLEGGVIVEELRQGTGPAAKPGKMVQVFYEGRIKNNNKVFDSATKGAGFKFRLGRAEVIKGWDVGISGMKVGGKRRVICPPAMAYGQKGSPPTIPPNSTLVFDVELKNVH